MPGRAINREEKLSIENGFHISNYWEEIQQQHETLHRTPEATKLIQKNTGEPRFIRKL